MALSNIHRQDFHFLIVHGGIAQAKSWDVFRQVLNDSGHSFSQLCWYTSECPRLPTWSGQSRSFEDDVVAIRSALLRFLGILDERPIVIVAHSYGAMVASAVLDSFSEGVPPRLRHVIYVSGLLPPIRGSLAQVFREQDVRPTMRFQTKNGLTSVENPAEPLSTNINEEALEQCLRMIAPHNWRHEEAQRASSYSWTRQVKGSYIVCEEDMELSPQLQIHMAQYAGLGRTVLRSGHCPQLSQPQALANAVLTILDVETQTTDRKVGEETIFQLDEDL